MARKKRSAPVAVRNKNPGLVPGISDLINLTDEETEIQAASNTDMAMIGEPSDLAKQHAKEEKDLFSIIEEVVDSKDIVPKDLKINDSSMPQAKNYYDWCTNEEFLGSDMPPYLEQALIGVKLFSEYCYHCSDLEWMEDDGHEPQDGLIEFERRVTLLEYGVCPKCGARRSHMMKEEQLNFYNELAVNAGQRSGKSALVAMLSTYITHRILKAQKPTQLFRVKSNTVFHGTFVALTYAQAKDTLWEPYYQYLCESPWFQKYHALLRRYEQKYGHEIFKLKDTFVLYRHRSLMVYPAGPDKRTLRGRTRVFGSVDEIGWFDNDKNSGKVKVNGSEVYIALERSLRTVRNSERRQIAAEYDEAMTGYFMNISSPSSQRDKICELVRQSHGSKKLLGLHKPTWEMNPEVTRADLDDEFRKDHGTAMRDYGAQPPLSSNPFITSEELVKGIIKKTGRNFANVTYKIYKAKDNAKYRWGFIDKVKSCDGKSVMAVDAGYSNNCFALAVGSLQKVEVDGEEVVIPVMDIVVEINPLPSIPLHYPKIYENIMIPLIEARNVKVLVADRWNSIKLLQDAELSTDIDLWKQYSLKYSDFIDFKTRMQQKQVLIPRPHVKQEFDEILALSTHDEYPMCFERMPVEHLILQMLTVQDAGKSVIKGDDLTDDIWRAVVLCEWALTNPEFLDNLKGAVADSKNKAALGTATFGSKAKSGGGAIASSRRSSIGTAKSLGKNNR